MIYRIFQDWKDFFLASPQPPPKEGAMVKRNGSKEFKEFEEKDYICGLKIIDPF